RGYKHAPRNPRIDLQPPAPPRNSYRVRLTRTLQEGRNIALRQFTQKMILLAGRTSSSRIAGLAIRRRISNQICHWRDQSLHLADIPDVVLGRDARHQFRKFRRRIRPKTRRQATAQKGPPESDRSKTKVTPGTDE